MWKTNETCRVPVGSGEGQGRQNNGGGKEFYSFILRMFCILKKIKKFKGIALFQDSQNG